jgi:phosphatidylglycerol:prolipoprotein diacylglycerol transferase
MDWTYSSIMMAAVSVGFFLSRWLKGRFLPLAPFERFGIALGAFAGAMVGAKLPFVLADWEGFRSGAAWFQDGKTITFGLVGGYFGVELTKWALDIRVKTGDAFAVPVAVSVGIGRLACFSAGCCHGTATALPWAVDFGDGVLRHPTQIYESLFHVSIAVFLGICLFRGAFRGQLIKLYIIAYFVYRFATEYIRPELRLALGLTGYQWAAVAFVPLFVALWVRDRRQERRGGVRPPEGSAPDPRGAP